MGTTFRQMHDLVLHLGHTEPFPDAAIESLALAVCRCSLSKAVMKLPKREGSTGTYLQRESFTETAPESEIWDQTRINLSDYWVSFS